MLSTGEYTKETEFLKDSIRVDVDQHLGSFTAIKKFLGEKGPFVNETLKTFTIAEKVHYTANTPPDVQRINNAHLVLGYGLRSVDYKGHKLWVWYRSVESPSKESSERISVYIQPFNAPVAESGEDKVEDNVQPWQILKNFINDALEFEQTEVQDETKIYTINEKTMTWQLSTEKPKRPMESVFLKADIKNDIINDMQKFLKGREFYASHGIPFKRGYLFYGPPGCGKSSLVSALAGKFNLNVCLLQIANKYVTDNILHSLLMTAPPHSVILIEDIDTLFVERTNANTNQSVTFSGFINAVDGVGSAEGKIVIVTTNHAAKIDPALLRPGRIDRKYKVDYVDKDEIIEMFLYYFPNKKKKAHLFADTVIGNYITTAELQCHYIKYQDDAASACANRYELVDKVAPRRDIMEKEGDKSNNGYSFSLW